MNLNFETQGVNFVEKRGKLVVDEIATPQHICNDMSNLFDYTDCNTKIWGDIYCKTGNTLSSIIKHGVNKNNIFAICDNKQSQMLVCRKLYGRILEEEEVQITEDQLNTCREYYEQKFEENTVNDIITYLRTSDITRRGQIYHVHGWQNIVKGNYKNAYNIIKFVILKEMENTMQLEWNSDKEFSIDNIIMNPPYNNDIYIDFVTLAKSIADDSVAITPTKFTAKAGEKNDNFRKDVVPYISDIIQYHDCREIFDIQETSGISIFRVGKNVVDIKRVINKCKANKNLETDEELHSEDKLILYPNNIIDIIRKCESIRNLSTSLSFKRCVFVGEQERGYNTKTNETDAEILQGNKVVGYMPIDKLYTTEGLEKYKVTSLILISMQCIFNGKEKITGSQSYNILVPNQVPKGSFPVLRYFDTREECESFKSYLESKLMSFLFFCGVCGGTLTSEFYRFIPDPGKFDHIFTDQELYDKYGLTKEEQAIIESVIKERK